MKPEARVGSVFGSYRIDAVLGRGGMGVVYRAEHLGLQRRVALKLLTPQLADDEAFRRRFVRESQLAASIDHPNIIPIYEAGEVEGEFFLAMRYVDGTDLDARLRDGPLAPATALELLGQAAGALDAAHEAGLVHRDVKPGNMLLAAARGGAAAHVYLTDFGLTKRTDSQTGLTAYGSFLGSLDYVAPEQVQGKSVDGRADVYALGCVLYQCLTGAIPFERDSEMAMLWAHVHEPPPAASERQPALPAAIDAVIARALAKDPAQRYPSGAALIAAARQALQPLLAPPAAIPAAARRRDPRLAIVGGLAVIAVAAIAGFALLGGDDSRDPAAGLLAASPAATAAASAEVALATAVETPSGEFPTAAEQALLEQVPDEVRDSCVRTETVPSFALPVGGRVPIPVHAALECAPGDAGQGVTVFYWTLARAPGSASDHIEAREVFFNVTGNNAIPEGDCASHRPQVAA